MCRCGRRPTVIEYHDALARKHVLAVACACGARTGTHYRGSGVALTRDMLLAVAREWNMGDAAVWPLWMELRTGTTQERMQIESEARTKAFLEPWKPLKVYPGRGVVAFGNA